MSNRQKAMLTRLHRVRTLQLNLTLADESRAHQRVATERQLSDRITQLVQAVAPSPAPPTAAAALMARAHFRNRLNESSDAAAGRVAAAERQADRAAEQTRDAKRDQTAVEKLIERARIAAIRAEMRALEDMPATASRRSHKRHDPC